MLLYELSPHSISLDFSSIDSKSHTAQAPLQQVYRSRHFWFLHKPQLFELYSCILSVPVRIIFHLICTKCPLLRLRLKLNSS
jgi:hypothetical protein